MENTVLRTITIDGRVITVVERKIRKFSLASLIKDTKKHADPSHESEKPANPLVFSRASFAQGYRTKPLWNGLRIPPNHMKTLFGEPTRVLAEEIEWVIKLRSKEILRIVINNKGTHICGFNRTETVEKFVNRLLNS